jgi:hypothetical protein
MLIDHLFFIFRAVFELKVYHPRWLESITLQCPHAFSGLSKM